MARSRKSPPPYASFAAKPRATSTARPLQWTADSTPVGSACRRYATRQNRGARSAWAWSPTTALLRGSAGGADHIPEGEADGQRPVDGGERASRYAQLEARRKAPRHHVVIDDVSDGRGDGAVA